MLLLSVLPASVAAQAPSEHPVIAQLPVSARAAGVGNAYPLSSPDADAIFYNPALMDDARGVSVSLSRFGSASHLISAAGGLAWWHGGLSFAASSLSYGAPSTTSGAFREGEGGLWRGGPAAASEQVGIVSYARTLFGFRIGGAAKLIDQRRGADHRTSGAADLGVVRSLGPVTLGFAARDLGRGADLDGIETRLPTSMTAAASTRSKSVGPLDVSLAGAAEWRRSNFHSAGGGVEIGYWPISGRTFTARAGYRWVDSSDVSPLTLGLGFSGDRISMDYAFEGVDRGRPTHRVTLRVR